MKTLPIRTYAPPILTINKRKYKRVSGEPSLILKGLKPSEMAVKLPVLPRSLRGRNDYHGNPYRPINWIYEPIK